MKNSIPPQKREAARRLRLEGKSYGEIKKILHIKSKGTLSYWFKDLILDNHVKEHMKNKIERDRDMRLSKFNKKRTEKVRTENRIIYKTARREISAIKKRDLFLLGIALYWGEGAKVKEGVNFNRLAIANADPKLIALFLRFVREILEVKEEKIRAGIQLHRNINETEAKQFWSKITKLPMDRFFITDQASSASRFKRANNFLPFGTMSVRINSRKLAYKMKGYIDGLSAQSGNRNKLEIM
ncbi:MAG: hypothetical protein M1320_00785 [Patescibacteria group bacterium]|nr:hypothetical protein [Patescibacteria group bacterium]